LASLARQSRQWTLPDVGAKLLAKASGEALFVRQDKEIP
jgi:hypothetical protein